MHINAGGARARDQPVHPRLGGAHRRDEDAGAQAGARPSTASTSAFGGARRDEEKSRAKERVFSFRSAQHRWDPKNQRPELWRLYNARKQPGESIRVFPLSNWTELDVWQYIYLENDPDRAALLRQGAARWSSATGTLIMVDDDRMPLEPGEAAELQQGALPHARLLPAHRRDRERRRHAPGDHREMLLTRTSERQGRVIDHDQSGSMEKKKQEGYF